MAIRKINYGRKQGGAGLGDGMEMEGGVKTDRERKKEPANAPRYTAGGTGLTGKSCGY